MSGKMTFEEVRKELWVVLPAAGREDLFHQLDRFFNPLFFLAALIGEAGGEASVLRVNWDEILQRRDDLRVHPSGWDADEKECTMRLTDRKDNTISFEVGV